MTDWREYHEATKHTRERLWRSPHTLDWANMPDPPLGTLPKAEAFSSAVSSCCRSCMRAWSSEYLQTEQEKAAFSRA